MTEGPRYRSVQGPSPDLTRSEIEIMKFVARGLSVKEIAERLTLSVHTVRNHIRHSYKKLGVHHRLEAVNAWRRIMGDTLDEPPGEVTVTVRHQGLTWHGPVPPAPPPDA